MTRKSSETVGSRTKRAAANLRAALCDGAT